MDPAERTRWVVARARTLGFDLCGVASAQGLPELAYLDEWLARGYAGEMRYLKDPRRRDPQHVLDGAQSIIVCALNYNTPEPRSTELPITVAAGFTPARRLADIPTASGQVPSAATREEDSLRGWISRYAWGDDYHEVVGEMLEALLAAIRTQFPEPFEARAYVDTGPIVERVAAKRAGLGWLAKNTCLINEKLGSWLFLGVIITTLELEPFVTSIDGLPPDLCGNCRLCIEACPTGAIVEPYVLDAHRCISYLTIELRGRIPEELRAPMGRHVFGCDICQDVCPYNRNAPTTQLAAFLPRTVEIRNSKTETRKRALTTDHYSLLTPDLMWLASLSEAEFREVFQGSPVKRTKWRGLVRNACIALGNALSGEKPTQVWSRAVTLLERLAESPDPVIAEHAKWALAQRPE